MMLSFISYTHIRLKPINMWWYIIPVCACKQKLTDYLSSQQCFFIYWANQCWSRFRGCKKKHQTYQLIDLLLGIFFALFLHSIFYFFQHTSFHTDVGQARDRLVSILPLGRNLSTPTLLEMNRSTLHNTGTIQYKQYYITYPSCDNRLCDKQKGVKL